MLLPEISQVGAWVVLGFTMGVAITIAAQMLNGRINMRRLLWGRHQDGEAYFSAERVQLLGFTLWAAFTYLTQALDTIGSGQLPDVPTETLALLGASHSYYLGGKAYAMLWKK